jgi:hypothetical protein
MVARRSGFGPQMFLKELDSRANTPEKIARYITGYCTDKNGLDPVKDKGVRRTIFVGESVRVVDMRYRSGLKRVTSVGRDLAREIRGEEMRDLSEFERNFSMDGRKRSWETWGDWYRRNRDYWFQLGWASFSDPEREEILLLDGFTQRYLDTGQWSYI